MLYLIEMSKMQKIGIGIAFLFIIGIISLFVLSFKSYFKYKKNKKKSEVAMEMITKNMKRSEVRDLFSHAKMKSTMNMDIFSCSAINGNKVEISVTYDNDLVINVGYKSKEYR